MDLLSLIAPFAERMVTDIKPGELTQSLITIYVAFRYLKPWLTAQMSRLDQKLSDHLTRVEQALNNLSESVKLGFAAGEERFKKLEDDVRELKKRVGT